MVLLAIALLAGAVAGLVRPRVGAFAPRPQITHLPLLAAGAGLNAAAWVLPDRVAPIALAASLAVLIAVAVANRRITGLAVVGLGLGVNLVSVAVNEGMPVRGDALVRAEIVAEAEVSTISFNGARHLESDRDALGILGDVLPVPLTREVLSFGDLIVVLGAADALRDLARRRAPRWTAAEHETYRWRIAITRASDDHVWGTAPRARPVSASQNSAPPEVTAPAMVERPRSRATASAPDFADASHSR